MVQALSLGAPILGCSVRSGPGGKMAARIKDEALAAGLCQRNLYVGTDGAEGRTAGQILAPGCPAVGTGFQVSLRTLPEGTAAPCRVVEQCTPLDG